MTSVGPQTRDQATAALFQRIIREKAQERELLKCPRCFDLMEALPLEVDDQGYQTVWWVCKNTGRKKCDFPLDMPMGVFWVKRSPADIKDGFMPRPKIELLPDRYKCLYPALFAASTMRPSQSRCASVTSRSSTVSSRSSLHTCDMPLSGLPSPLTPATAEWDSCVTNSSTSQQEVIVDQFSSTSWDSTPSTSSETVKSDTNIGVQSNTQNQNIQQEMLTEPATTSFPEEDYDSDAYRAVRKRVDERIARRNRTRRRESVIEGQSLVTLYSQIKTLDLSKLNVDELESILEKCDFDMRTVVIPSASAKIKREQIAEHARVARDVYRDIDINEIENKVQEKTAVDKLNMLYSLRQARDGSTLMAVLGAQNPRRASTILEDNDPGRMQEFIKARMKEISQMISKKKKEDNRLLAKAAQEMTESRALEKRRSDATASSHHNAEEVRRRKAAKLECEHKIKALVQSKVAAFKEAKRKKILASNDLRKQHIPSAVSDQQPDSFAYSNQYMSDLLDNNSVSDHGDLFAHCDHQDSSNLNAFSSFGDLIDDNPFSNAELNNSFLDFPM